MYILITVVRVAFEVLNWLIIARVILSWFPASPHNGLIRFIYDVTEPILSPFRRLMPKSAMPVDFSPLIAILVLQLVQRLVLSLLASL